MVCLSALERSTGEVRWTRCEDASVAGRVNGATLVVARAMYVIPPEATLATLAVVGDDGVDRWRGGVLFPIVGVGSVVVAAVGAEGPIEGIDARTGATLWSHPASEGRPIGATAGVVIQRTEGNPIPLPLSGVHPHGRRRCVPSMRTRGPRCGLARSTCSKEPLGWLNSTVSRSCRPPWAIRGSPDRALVVRRWQTLVIDATTGAEIVYADGIDAAAATDQVLPEWRWSPGGQPEVAYCHVATGASLSIVTGVSPAYPLAPTMTWGAQGTGTRVWVMDVKMPSPGDKTGDVTSGNERYWAVVDAADGRQVWRVDHGSAVGRDDTTVLTTDASKLAFHEVATGTVLWRTEIHEPAGRVNATAAAFDSDLIVVDVDKVYGD